MATNQSNSADQNDQPEYFGMRNEELEDGDTISIGHSARILTEEEIAKLEKDSKVISEFKQRKFELEAQKNWDLFYKRNTTKFFKDRHWTKAEFSELFSDSNNQEGKRTTLEVGCGVGNFIFPLLEENKNLFFYACDFSKRAVQFVKENPLYDTNRCHAFQCDITKDELTNEIEANSVDVTSLIFVLSAIHPDRMAAALCNIYRVIKPGGKIVFRDYGLYDYAMLRFSSGHKLSDNFYVRQDGTRAYYFSLEKLNGLMEEAGFIVLDSNYVQRDTVNKKEGLCVPRIFVQGKFLKPECSNPYIPNVASESVNNPNVTSESTNDRTCATNTADGEEHLCISDDIG